MITNREIAWYNLAVKIAADSNAYDRHGCVLVRSGTVLGVATNRRVISHPISQQFNKRDIHAEQRLLSRVNDASGTTLYSARDHKNPTSFPCIMCCGLLLNANVKWVVFHNGNTLEKMRV
jgi:tRNA(Arg) A34 adenosine deaminase TadA